MSGLLDFLQGASNSAAGAVSGPIDLINMGLLGAGLPMPAAPFGGSQWMREQGLMRDPQNRTAGLLGEAVGGVLPIVAAAKAPQIARGLLQAGDNLRAPNPMNTATRGQAGAIVYHGSPHKFDKFDLNAPKTTGGAFNKHGVSVSSDKTVAERYAKDFGGGNGVVYKIDESTKAPLKMSARDFYQLQELTGLAERSAGGVLPELKSVGLEMLLKKYGIQWSDGIHPINAIKQAGYDSIWGAAGRAGAESEALIFDPALLNILSRK
jgi:hypothetical protein